MYLGILLVLIGVVFFLKNLWILPIDTSVWGFIWPLLFVAFGVNLIMIAQRGRKLGHWLFRKYIDKDEDH